jgi:signal transduction histidine kinase/CheY-like chemotaxis protein/streptogramin lyase
VGGGEIFRLNPDEQWEAFSTQNGLVLGDRPKITQTRNGDIWVATNHTQADLNQYDADKKKWIHHPAISRRGSNIHTAILETREGTLWVGGHNGTLHSFREGVWTVANPADVPISQTRIIGLLETADGALWIAGLGQEATRLDYGTSRWTTFTDLGYECETQDGSIWFTSKSHRVVRKQKNGEWISYGAEDGLIDTPTKLMATRGGALWATGRHNRQAATASFHVGEPNDRMWALKSHPHLGPSIDWRTTLEALDGTLWFGASVGRLADEGQLGGVLNYDPKFDIWRHYIPPDAPAYVYGIGQTTDGSIWFGATGLIRFDPSKGSEAWSRLGKPKGLTSWVHGIMGSDDGGLWVGTRAYGLYYLDSVAHTEPGAWKRYGVRDGLSNNRINLILQDQDGSIWVTTDKGISRFDGQTWTTHALPVELLGGEAKLHQSSDGAIWIQSLLGSVRYSPESDPPETVMEVAPLTLFQPGNATLAWHGTDPWRSTQDNDLQYAWRLDKGPWSPFFHQVNKSFAELPSGDHTFEVKARDLDFNEDPTPATVHLYVIPPVWQQTWFIGLMSILCVAIGIQSGRVIRRDRRLQESNRQLHLQTDELAAANRQIQEANRLKSQFLANMSHELRTPLNAIMGFAQLMTRDRTLTSGQRENLSVIGRSGEHLLALINDVLDMSKIEAGQTTLNEAAFDLYRLIDDLEGMFKLRTDSKALALVFERAADVPQYVHADENKLRQVLINLLGNAIKFTETGQIGLRVTSDELRLLFEVEDTGPGIAPEEQAVLFDAFVQTTAGLHVQEGTGLGLPISREFVRLIGGEISIISQIGSGSQFKFDIPITLTVADLVVAAGPTRRVAGLEPNQPVYRILIVEDRLENRRLLSLLLRPLGFEVQEAANGQEAVEMWERWEPHFIWMDMRMPVMDGYEATRQIKAKLRGQATVIVALTASAFEEQRAEVLSAGCDGFVRKPFKENELFETMAKHLGVRFIYEDEPADQIVKASIVLNEDALAAFPKEWVARVFQAASQADAEQIDVLLDEMGDDALADALRKLVNDFQFDRVMALTKWAEPDTH